MTITGMGATRLRWPDGRVSIAGVRSTPARTGRTSPAEQSRLRADVGGVLRRERLAHGWKQRHLAEAAGYPRVTVGMIECGAWRPSETSTLRLAEALRHGGTPVEVAKLDLELQRAAGESLRRWRRKPLSARTRRVYERAAAELDAEPSPSRPEAVALGRLIAALAPRWEPPA